MAAGLSEAYFVLLLPKPIEREHDPVAHDQLMLPKPFMLRRLKKDLLHELPPKTEIDQYATLVPKQVGRQTMPTSRQDVQQSWL